MDLIKRSAVNLSIVFSFRNEALVLNELVNRVRKAMSTAASKNLIKTYQIVFVNDASSDDSLALLLKLAAECNDIGIINMSRTFGVAPCFMAGLSHAKGDAVVCLDCDLQDPPELIVQMLEEYINRPDVDIVHTVRLNRQGESKFKLFITDIGYTILNHFSNVSLTPQVGDFKLLSRRVVAHILEFKEIRPFMRGIIAWVGFKQSFVSYTREPRFAGKSKFFVLGPKVISNFLNSAIVNFSSIPLQIATYCGLLAILGDFAVVIHAFHQKFSGQAVPGWTAIMVVTLFIGGVQLFCLGMIGLYLNSVHEQTKMRPPYIISSTYGLTT